VYKLFITVRAYFEKAQQRSLTSGMYSEDSSAGTAINHAVITRCDEVVE